MSHSNPLAKQNTASRPVGWRNMRIKYVAQVSTSNVDKLLVDGEQPVRLCNYTDVYYHDRIVPDLDFMEASATAKEIEKFQLRADQVIITKDSEGWDDIGIPALVTEDMPGVLCGYHLAIFTPTPNVLDGGYLAWLCCADVLNDHFKLSANGVTRFGLGQYAMKNAVISFPDMKTQKRIAAVLDERTAQIDALIAKKRKLLDRLAEKRQAIITQSVTKGLDALAPMKDTGVSWIGRTPAHWVVCQLGQKIKLQRGVDITKADRVDGPYPVVSSGGIDYFHDTALCKAPGVLIGRKGSAGKLHYVDVDFWPHDTTLYIKRYGQNLPRFVWYLFHTLDLTSFDTGSSNPTVNRNRVHPMYTSWPDPEEQGYIVASLDRILFQIENHGQKIQRSVNGLEEYRGALITAAVTGQMEI